MNLIFENELRDLVRSVPGAAGAVVMGFDGIAIEEYKSEPSLDLSAFGAEFSTVLKHIEGSGDILDCGRLDDLTCRYAGRLVVCRRLNESYFLLAVLAAGALDGKERYLIRRHLDRFQSELRI